MHDAVIVRDGDYVVEYFIYQNTSCDVMQSNNDLVIVSGAAILIILAMAVAVGMVIFFVGLLYIRRLVHC